MKELLHDLPKLIALGITLAELYLHRNEIKAQVVKRIPGQADHAAIRRRLQGSEISS